MMMGDAGGGGKGGTERRTEPSHAHGGGPGRRPSTNSFYASGMQPQAGPHGAVGPLEAERPVKGTGALINRWTGAAAGVPSALTSAREQRSPHVSTVSDIEWRTSTVRPFCGQRYS